MDFERIKQNLRIRSGRTSTNMSKRFPTRVLEKTEPPQSSVKEQLPTSPRRKAKLSVNGVDHPMRDKECAAPCLSTANPPCKTTKTRSAKQPQSTREPKLKRESSGSEDADYDLRPAPPKPKKSQLQSLSLEELFGLLYSESYLNTLTGDPRLLSQFSSFLSKYKPTLSPLVLQYLETQKIIKSIHYANAVASSLPVFSTSAASLSREFREYSAGIFSQLLTVALPAWTTYSLTKAATLCLTSEITNTSTSLTKDLVRGLSEVFCLTDPTLPDNPIIYASPEFYSLTSYPKEKVIGYNCRFLQAKSTDRKAVERLKAAIQKEEEICEALLNYTRDGKPFVNLLLLAPLRDGKGKVKYYLGAQVDCSKLVEGRKGVAGFERFLGEWEAKSRDGEKQGKEKALETLGELSKAFDLEESAVVRSGRSRRGSNERRDFENGSMAGSSKARRRIQDEEDSEDGSSTDTEMESSEWKLAGDPDSGQLPGLYRTYVLVRPYPSLRMIFVSQAAKKFGKLQQRHFLAHAAAPPATLKGLKESLESGTPVTAKIALMSKAGESKEGTVTGKWGKKGGPADKGTVCWVSSTPLLDADDKVGVWMIVFVDEKTAALNIGRVPAPFSNHKDASNQRSSAPDDFSAFDEANSRAMRDIDNMLPIRSPEETLGAPSNFAGSAKSQRSDPKPEEQEMAIANGVPESTIGSRTSNRPRSLSPAMVEEEHPLNGTRAREIEAEPRTPPARDLSAASDRTPTQRSAGRDIGLRALDYLSSRSSRQVDARDGEDRGEENEDLSAESPYSID